MIELGMKLQHPKTGAVIECVDLYELGAHYPDQWGDFKNFDGTTTMRRLSQVEYEYSVRTKTLNVVD